MPGPDYVTYYTEKSKEPGFSFEVMRKELAANNVEPEKIELIVRVVNNDMIRRDQEVEDEKKSSWGPLGNPRVLVGCSIMAIALGVIVGGGGKHIFVAHGSLIVGFLTVLSVFIRGGNSDSGGNHKPPTHGRWR